MSTPDATPEQTLTMPVFAGDTEVLPVPETPELSDFGQQAEAQFLEWVDAFQARTRADWNGRIGTLPGTTGGTERNRIFGNCDAGMLACRRIAAQAVLAALPAARTPASHHRSEAPDITPAAWTAPLPAIEGLPRHGHRRTGGAA